MGKDQWFPIRSWHALKRLNMFTSRANIDFTVAIAYCGKSIEFRTDTENSPIDDHFNYQEKTCESCFRNRERVRV